MLEPGFNPGIFNLEPDLNHIFPASKDERRKSSFYSFPRPMCLLCSRYLGTKVGMAEAPIYPWSLYQKYIKVSHALNKQTQTHSKYTKRCLPYFRWTLIIIARRYSHFWVIHSTWSQTRLIDSHLTKRIWHKW